MRDQHTFQTLKSNFLAVNTRFSTPSLKSDWELAFERETVIRPLAQAVRLGSWHVAECGQCRWDLSQRDFSAHRALARSFRSKK
jgi:hypothetical protein